jgi:hypothetical protein
MRIPGLVGAAGGDTRASDAATVHVSHLNEAAERFLFNLTYSINWGHTLTSWCGSAARALWY